MCSRAIDKGYTGIEVPAIRLELVLLDILNTRSKDEFLSRFPIVLEYVPNYHEDRPLPQPQPEDAWAHGVIARWRIQGFI